MTRTKVEFETLSDIKKFVEICSGLPAGAKVQVVDDETDQRVNGTSLLGVVSSMEWHSTYVESQMDIYDAIKEFVPVACLD